MFIPAGFAHGFSVLSEKAEVFYKCDQFYNKESEGGIRYNDPQLNIDWKIPADKAIVSEKDRSLLFWQIVKTILNLKADGKDQKYWLQGPMASWEKNFRFYLLIFRNLNLFFCQEKILLFIMLNR